MAITVDDKNLTDEFEFYFKTGMDSWDYGCGMVNKEKTVYVGEATGFEEDDEIGFDLSLLSEKPEKVIYEGDAKVELYKFVPENGEPTFISDDILDKVMKLFDMESPNDYFELINLHPKGEWPVCIEHPEGGDNIALIAPRIMPNEN